MINSDTQKEIMKDIKTATKFIRIASTMLHNISEEILDNKLQSDVADELSNISSNLNIISNNVEKSIEKFKTEEKIPGCQLELKLY